MTQNYEHKQDKKSGYPSILSTKLGLALGGGGARGIAHVGILKAFEEQSINLSGIAGTSAGALVATLFAFGKSSKEIEVLLRSLSFSRLSSFRKEKLGFVSNKRISQLLIEEIGDAQIENALIPLAIVCTDLITGKKKIFTKGPAAILVQASSSFPGLYTPVEYEDMLLVDGALTENIPVSGVKSLGANFVIAVSLSEDQPHLAKPNGIFDVISRSFDIMVDHASSRHLKDAEYTIKLDLDFMSRFKIVDGDKAIQLAYNGVHKMLSRPILYWWIKPFLDYAYLIFEEAKKLIAAFFSNPKFGRPFSFSKTLYKHLSEKYKID